MSGSPAGGVQSPSSPPARTALRASASSNSGLRVFSMLSAMPAPYRLMVSTPPATKQSPSPAAMAWAAIRMVCSDDEQ